MQTTKHLWSLYLIIATIVISVAVQVYFNFKNYQLNKQQFIDKVQLSLDNATDIYYAEIAKSLPKKLTTELKKKNSGKDEITIYLYDGKFKQNTTIDWKSFDNKKRPELPDSITKQIIQLSKKPIPTIATDSVKFIREISTLYMSISSDSLNFKDLNTNIKTEFQRQKINIPYILNHYKNELIIATNDSITNFNNPIKTLAKSTYLKKEEKIELLFPNQTKTFLKQGLVGILLSFLLATAIIASLFYLLQIIKKQKQIAEIKNDFISNITHEFKTPITTISVATEALKSFNNLKNTVKTEEYLDITNQQLEKLNVMVEKILETSTLDSDKLLLEKETINIVELVKKATLNHNISFNTSVDKFNMQVDVFHFENVINNLLDNAIKYGGKIIKVNLLKTINTFEITVSDNGEIPKNQKEKIFDKFYRIPKGDTHDVKGFGIGLYYAKKITEKHNGTLTLLNTKKTVFKISLDK